MSNGGSISLESALRTCKIDTAWADKVQSDRFLNPNQMVCPIWNGIDTAGRTVCPDSFMTKNAGCNSAEDRVLVENNVSRPQYMEYVNLSAGGIAGNVYGNTLPYQNEVRRTQRLKNAFKHTGQFGNSAGFQGQTLPGCNGMGSSGMGSYDQTYPRRNQTAWNSQRNRQANAAVSGYESYSRKSCSGN